MSANYKNIISTHIFAKTYLHKISKPTSKSFIQIFKLSNHLYLQFSIITLSYSSIKFKTDMQTGLQTIIPHEILQLRHIFGINNIIPNSLHLLSSEKFLYVAGYYVVVFNPKEKEKSQNYYSGAEGYKSITSVSVSSNKKNMAMGLQGEGKPAIYYYELNVSAKRKKIQFTQPLAAKEWVSIAFTSGNDVKFMASLSSKAGGESILAYWNPDKNKCLTFIRIPTHHQEKNDLIEVLFSPNSSSSQNQLLSVLGQKTFRLLRIVEEEDKTVDIQNVALEINGYQPSGMKSHVYLQTSAEILILTETELVIVDQKGLFQQRMPLPFVSQCISSWGQGFLVGGVGGIAVYRYQAKDSFVMKMIIDFDKELSVKSIAMFDDRLGAMLSNGQLVQTRLKVEKQQPKAILEQVGLQYHNGPIVSMDVCIRKPLIATAGKDKAIKIWNYQQKTVETTRNQTEAALCLSFHPSGLHLIIAFSDKLRMMNVQKDGQTLNGYKDINGFKNCSQIKFSNGGHLFAAVSGTSVHVFKFYTGENPPGMTFTGHNGKIRCIAWSKDDNFLVTCGTDGIILAYRVGMEGLGSKLVYISNSKQSRYKGIGYSCATVTADNKIYAVGSVANTNERILKEISLDGTQTKRELPSLNLGQIAFPSSGRVLIGGVDDKDRSAGSLKCYKFLLSQHVQQFPAHDERGVERIRITSDDKYVVSAGKDGCLFLFEIRDKEAKSDKIKENYVFSNDVLVMKSDLDTVKSQIQNLKQQKNQLQSIQLSGQMPKQESTKQMRENYISKQQQFAHAYALHLDKKTLQKKRFQEQLRATKQKYQTDLQGYDSNQSKNVMQESAQYDALKSTQMIENQRYEKEIQQNKDQYRREMQQLEEQYKKRIKKERDEKMQFERKLELQDRTHKQIMQSIMEQKQEELHNLDDDNSRKVQNLTEATLKANSDVSINKKKINQQENQKQKHLQKQRQNRQQTTRLHEENKALIKDIEQQTLIIQEKDKIIGENQRKIYEQKKKSQELQKFKYVLDHKIKQLKKDIGPRQKEIAEMKVVTNKMDKRLKHFNSLNSGLAEFVSVLLKDEQNLKTEINNQRSRISFQTVKIKQFKDAIYQAVQFIQDEQKLQEEVINLSKKFVTHKISQVKMDSQIEQEYKNQKRYLQKSVAMLKRNLQKDNEIHKHDNVRIMKQNVELIKDINKLRMQTRDGLLKKGPDDQRRNKIDPREEQLKQEIRIRKQANENVTAELQGLARELERLNGQDDYQY